MCQMELKMQKRGPDEKQHAEKTDKAERLWKMSCFRNIVSFLTVRTVDICSKFRVTASGVVNIATLSLGLELRFS